MAKSGSDVFIDSLNSLVNKDDMNAVLDSQTQMLERFEKTNEMLSKFNQLSMNQYEMLSTQFKDHTAMLLDMRKDIDSIFRRIRILKTKLATEYPDAFKVATQTLPNEPMEPINLSGMETATPPPQQIVNVIHEGEDDDALSSEGHGLHNVPSIN